MLPGLRSSSAPRTGRGARPHEGTLARRRRTVSNGIEWSVRGDEHAGVRRFHPGRASPAASQPPGGRGRRLGGQPGSGGGDGQRRLRGRLVHPRPARRLRAIPAHHVGHRVAAGTSRRGAGLPGLRQGGQDTGCACPSHGDPARRHRPTGRPRGSRGSCRLQGLADEHRRRGRRGRQGGPGLPGQGRRGRQRQGAPGACRHRGRAGHGIRPRRGDGASPPGAGPVRLEVATTRAATSEMLRACTATPRAGSSPRRRWLPWPHRRPPRADRTAGCGRRRSHSAGPRSAGPGWRCGHPC